MKKINVHIDFFAKYISTIEESDYYHPINKVFTYYTGFESKGHHGSFIMKFRDKLEVYESDSIDIFGMIKI